ncbi:MAG: metal-dependent hydrolase [Candidatus Methanoperedens sp.]
MTPPLDHIFIPVAILLLFSKKLNLNPREVIALSFFAVLPDIDGIFFGSNNIPLHRVLFHNIFIVIIPLLFFMFTKSKQEVFGIICFYLTSHLILDLFTGGIFLFYPVYNNVFFAHVELLLSHSSFIPVLEYGISNKIMNNGIGEPAISSENVAFVILLIICAAISAIVIHRKTE